MKKQWYSSSLPHQLIKSRRPSNPETDFTLHRNLLQVPNPGVFLIKLARRSNIISVYCRTKRTKAGSDSSNCFKSLFGLLSFTYSAQKNYTSSHWVVPLPHPLLRLLCASHLPLNDLQVTDTVIDLGRGGWISKASFPQVRSAVVIFPFYNIFLHFYNDGQESLCRWSGDD